MPAIVHALQGLIPHKLNTRLTDSLVNVALKTHLGRDVNGMDVKKVQFLTGMNTASIGVMYADKIIGHINVDLQYDLDAVNFACFIKFAYSPFKSE
jgi:hypothetical protein